MSDPLEQIMKRLRQQKAVDPGQMQARQARMGEERQRAGAAPQPHPRQRPDQPSPQGQGQPAPTGEDIDAGDMTMPQMDMIPVIVDQLNESIISGKVALHRTQNPQEKQKLEQALEQARQTILNLGGEPIWGDESIEEGVAKLQGFGFAGADTLNFALQGLPFEGTPWGTQLGARGVGALEMDLDQMAQDFRASQPGSPYMPSDYIPPGATVPATGTQTGGRTGAQTGVPQVPDRTPTNDVFRALDIAGEQDVGTRHPAFSAQEDPQLGIPVRPFLEAAGARLDWDAETGQVIVRGPEGEARLDPTGVQDPGVSFAHEAELRRVLEQVGLRADRTEIPLVGAPIRHGDIEIRPAPELTWQDTLDQARDVFDAVGLDLESLPTMEDYVHLEELRVERAAMDRRQLVQRDIDRYERDHEHEFAKAKKQVSEWAKEMAADAREDMSTRGMLYSSVMGQALAEIDSTAVEIIGEIARDAANVIAELRADLRDIAEWEILETMIVRKQAQFEFMEQRAELASMLSEVQHRNQMAGIAQYGAQMDAYFGAYDAEVQRVQTEYDRVVNEAGYEALGMLGNTPIIRQGLQASGLWGTFQASDMYTQAHMVDFMVNDILPAEERRMLTEQQVATLAAQAATERQRQQNLGIEASLLQSQGYLQQLTEEAMIAELQGTATAEQSRFLEGTGMFHIPEGDPVGQIVKTLEALAMFTAYANNPEFAGTPEGQRFLNAATEEIRAHVARDPDSLTGSAWAMLIDTHESDFDQLVRGTVESDKLGSVFRMIEQTMQQHVEIPIARAVLTSDWIPDAIQGLTIGRYLGTVGDEERKDAVLRQILRDVPPHQDPGVHRILDMLR